MVFFQSIVYISAAILAGAFFPAQAGINHQLTGWSQSPVISSAVSFAVGTLCLFLCIVLFKIPVPSLSLAATQPWWIWIGGALGAYSVYSMVFLAPKLGAVSMLSCILAGQILAAVLLDQFGVLGYAQQSINAPKIIGIILIFIGVFLVRLT